LEVNY